MVHHQEGKYMSEIAPTSRSRNTKNDIGVKAVPPRETGITRRAVADLQAQIESLTAAVAALSTQHATPVFRQERNNQTAIDDEFEEDKNPLSRLRCQPLIRNNNNNDSYFDNKYEDLDIKVYDTRDNDNSYVVQLGGPIFDVSDTEEEEENFSEQNFDPIFDVSDQDDTENFSTHDVANEDVTEIAPIYDMFEEDEMNQVIVGKVEDESIKFNESVYAEEILTFSNEAFVKSNDIIPDFNLKDTSPLCQTMKETLGQSDNYFWKTNRSNQREDHMDVPKPELIPICDERAGNTFLDLQKKHMNYGAWRNNFNRHINREPPDRVPHQDRCVRQQWSTGSMSAILKTQRCLIGEEFVSILQQCVVTPVKQRNDQYWHLHRAHMRLLKKEEVEDCNDEKVGGDVYPTSDEDSSEQTIISLGLEIPLHHSLESILILNKVFLASIHVEIHKNELYMATLVSGRSLHAGESHSYVDVLFERNTTFLACWTNVIMVNWNINESSDSYLKNLIKENHAEVLTAIYDISFLRRLVSSLGSVLVYAFTGGEDSMFLWPLLAPTTSIRILGFSYNITVVFITRISSFLRMHILPLRFRKGSLESVVYWQVRHCGFHKLRIWDVDKLLKNLNDISTTATWRSYVTCVSSKYLWEAYSCVIWFHCNTIFLPLPSWIDFSTLLGAISQEVFPFQDPWNKVFQLLANYHLFHVKLCGLVQPPYIILWSLLKILLRSINGEINNHCQFLDFKTCEKIFEDVRRYACGVEWDWHFMKTDSFNLLLVNMQLGVVQKFSFLC
ncbi:hypothetical protein IGI04_019552 [Brassica rapa subsp. trilocularis]|uniref:Reverse transcriptase zinc-binding domain-containing protein n=1 Tax=Brassica rapa subsp. trilocularis TaxID=1813537 RepID=A0ABQ7MHR8_BRACM|nr:hypothetical protein IGI04_019552 [Brassica rapa subsp. trilocularis]